MHCNFIPYEIRFPKSTNTCSQNHYHDKKVYFSFNILLLTIASLAQQKTKVACIGNSITFAGYPALLNVQLGEEWEVRNFGVRGTTMLRNGDDPYYKTKAYEEARAFNPDVVVIKLGTNDSKPQNWKYKDQYVPDYTRMINELKSLPSKPIIVVCFPVPAYSHGWDINDSILRNETIPMIKEIAKTNNVKIIDLYKPLSNHKDWFRTEFTQMIREARRLQK